ncbi:MAG: hypothetical protein RL307_164, partial [Pseudomonadota bacterium]
MGIRIRLGTCLASLVVALGLISP